MVHSYRARRLNWIGGASALGDPIGPKGMTTAAQPPYVPVGGPQSRQANVIRWPKGGLAGLLFVSTGEFVCRLWFQDAAPCSVSPVVTRATNEVSMPLIRKF